MPVNASWRPGVSPRVLAALFLVAVAASASPAPAPPAVPPIEGRTPDERAAAFLAFCAAERPRREDFPKEAMGYCLARLILNRDVDYAIAKIDAAAAATLKASRDRLRKDPADLNALDPFNQHALVNGYLLQPDRFPASTVRAIREFVSLNGHREWRGFGSTNYRLMRDGSGFLAAERWPDLKDADGLGAEEIRRATAGRLYGCFDTIVRKNLDEYNAPTYYTTDLMAVRMLAEFARDAEMKRRATRTLDWMMLDLACSWNQGYHVATAGRSKGWSCVATSPDAPDTTAAVGWIFFGGRRGINPVQACPHHTFWLAYPGAYRLPAIVTDVALDRAVPFPARESVLSVGGCDIRKVLWQSPSYGLTCQWEDAPNKACALFKETKRQMLKWVSDRPASTFSIQQENYLRPYRPKDVTPNAFGYGENPFHQILQHEMTQVGIYAVPEGYPFHQMYVPFTTQGAIVRRIEKDGWIFCHGGGMLFGFRLVKPGAWGKPQRDCDVLWSDHRKNGWVLETSELKSYAGGGPETELDRFAEDVLKKVRIDTAGIDDAAPRLQVTSLQGRRLEIVFRPFGTPYTDQHRVDGRPVDYRAFPLLENPWVRQAVDGDVLTVKHGGATRTWNFKTWTTEGTP